MREDQRARFLVCIIIFISSSISSAVSFFLQVGATIRLEALTICRTFGFFIARSNKQHNTKQNKE